MSKKQTLPPTKRSATRRSSRTVPVSLRAEVVFSGPLFALAARYRYEAAMRKRFRADDQMIPVLEATAAEIEAAITEGRKNQYLSAEMVAELVGLEVDTVRKHCGSGKIAPAMKVGGVWLIHCSAVEMGSDAGLPEAA